MKYAPSALIGRLSRSAGATTAAHNRFGAYLRNRVIPTNPQSVKQTAVRSAFSNNAAAWRDLTPVQRAGWAELGAQMTRTDSLGQTYTYTGLNAFVSVRTNNGTYGSTLSVNPPVLATPTAPTGVTLDVTAGIGATVEIAWTSGALGASTKLAVFAAPPVSAGINFLPPSRFKLLQVSSAAATSPLDVVTAYELLFGPLQAGEKVVLRLVTLNAAGFAAPPIEISAIVA